MAKKYPPLNDRDELKTVQVSEQAEFQDVMKALSVQMPSIDNEELDEKSMQRVIVLNKKLKRLSMIEQKTILSKFATEFIYLGFHPFLGTDKVSLVYSTQRKGVIDLLGLPGALMTTYKLHGIIITQPQDWWNAIIQCISTQVFFEYYSRKDEMYMLMREEDINCEVTEMNPEIWIPLVLQEMNQGMLTRHLPTNGDGETFLDLCKYNSSTSDNVAQLVNLNSIIAGHKYRFSNKTVAKRNYLCGIYGVKLLGSEDDWKNLLSRFNQLNAFLERTSEDYGIEKPWRDQIAYILQMLYKTYTEQTRNAEVKTFWSQMITRDGADCLNDISLTGWLAYFFSCKAVIDSIKIDKIPQDFNISTTPIDIVFNRKRIHKFILASGIIGYDIYHDKRSQRWFITPTQDYALYKVKDS